MQALRLKLKRLHQTCISTAVGAGSAPGIKHKSSVSESKGIRQKCSGLELGGNVAVCITDGTSFAVVLCLLVQPMIAELSLNYSESLG